ncbi:MAG: ribbon-helix-helix domain-containing protein [Candidatus Methanoperedens sp.]|nr:ribbon-helix-helix domain-containing protein [Candidatus Methanoperedens sp.]
MARITVKIDDEIEKKVRMKIAKHGGKKGDLAKAVEEALKLWLEHKETT